MDKTFRSLAYAVFVTNSPDATARARNSVVTLKSNACAQFLQPFFDTLFSAHGIGISIYDDTTVSGEHLDYLAEAVADATIAAKAQPITWDAVIGYEHVPGSEALGDPIVETASRDELLTFLRELSEKIIEAKQCDGYLQIGTTM